MNKLGASATQVSATLRHTETVTTDHWNVETIREGRQCVAPWNMVTNNEETSDDD